MASSPAISAAPAAPDDPHRFGSLRELARLPWFAVGEHGRLVVRDPSLGPIIDVHSHVALAYLRPISVDLHRETPETQHYLPGCCEFHLDVYANRNFTPEQLKALSRDLTWKSVGPDGMRATHTAANLARDMGDLGVARSVVLPIDFPVLSDNASNAIAVAKADERLVGFGSVHPWASDVAGRLDSQAHRGVLGVKVHPAVQLVKPDSQRSMRLYRAAGERNLPILIHCGPVGIELAIGRFLTQVRHYERAIAANPKTRFVLGHSGALQWEQALALALKYPNVWLEISSQSLTAVRAIVEKADPKRILFGSDWPFYSQALPLAKVLIATEGRADVRERILFRNAMELLHLHV